MDKNTLVGFALIGAVVIGFSIYNRPSQEEMARAKHYQDSIQAIAQKEAERLAQAATAQQYSIETTSFIPVIYQSGNRQIRNENYNIIR